MSISLKAARVNMELTQMEAAKKIGVSTSTIKNWEAGKTSPTQPELERICEVYKISYDMLRF